MEWHWVMLGYCVARSVWTRCKTHKISDMSMLAFNFRTCYSLKDMGSEMVWCLTLLLCLLNCERIYYQMNVWSRKSQEPSWKQVYFVSIDRSFGALNWWEWDSLALGLPWTFSTEGKLQFGLEEKYCSSDQEVVIHGVGVCITACLDQYCCIC